MKRILLFALLICQLSSFAQVVESTKQREGKDEITWMGMTGFTIYSVDRLFIYGANYSLMAELASPTDNIAFTLGSHFGLGASYNSFNGGFLMLDAPILAHMHLGHNATRNSEFPIGIMIGAGMGLNQILASGITGQFSYGPMLDAGIKIDLPMRSVTLRGSFMLNLNDNLIGGEMINLGLSTNL